MVNESHYGTVHRTVRYCDDAQLIRGAKDKLAEFRALRYPVSVLRQACSFLAASESRGAWITARMSLEDDETHGPKAGS